MLFFRWSPVKIENGVVVYEKCPALCVVQPRASILRCDFAVILDAQSAPKLAVRIAMH